MAIKWAESPARPAVATDLLRAVELLQAERSSGKLAGEHIPWSQVAVDDQVQGAKSGRWFTIDRTVTSADGATVKAWAKGIPDAATHNAESFAYVKRGEMGRAVDMFTSVIWSGTESMEAPE